MSESVVVLIKAAVGTASRAQEAHRKAERNVKDEKTKAYHASKVKEMGTLIESHRGKW